MRTNVDRHHNVAFDVKDNAQIRSDFGRIDRYGHNARKVYGSCGYAGANQKDLP
jgi:hypothetical protein